MSEVDLSRALLFATDARGFYIPQHFAETVNREKVTGVTAEQYATLEQGIEAEGYWDVWEQVLNGARLTSDTGIVFVLHQDGDLWVVPQEDLY